MFTIPKIHIISTINMAQLCVRRVWTVSTAFSDSIAHVISFTLILMATCVTSSGHVGVRIECHNNRNLGSICSSDRDQAACVLKRVWTDENRHPDTLVEYQDGCILEETIVTVGSNIRVGGNWDESRTLIYTGRLQKKKSITGRAVCDQ